MAFRISHHSHTGRHQPHQHTSYAGLAFLLMFVGILLAGTSVSSWAAPRPGPESGSIGLSGKRAGVPPKNAPIITEPRSGQRFSVTPVQVGGTCGADTIVQVFKNDIFAGSAACTPDGRFGVEIDLLYGQNTLVARGYDALDQVSPDSNLVNVFYDALPPQASPLDPSNGLGNQLLLRTSGVYRGVQPGREMALPLEIIGGNSPFSVSIDWGADKPDLITRNNNVPFNGLHTYKRPGSYQVTVKASDIRGQSAVLTVVVIVNGPAEIMATANQEGGSSNFSSRLIIAWPLYLLALVAVISFWLGEIREKQHLLHLAA